MQKYRESKILNRAAIPVPDLSHIDILDLDFIGRRVYLASFGWSTDFRIERQSNGKISFGMWAKHNNWMGTLASVCLHTHGFLSVEDTDISSILKIYDDISLEITRRCILAMEHYQDGVPFQNIYGELQYNYREHEYFKSFPSDMVVLPKRANPTEFLPGWPSYQDRENIFVKNPSALVDLVKSQVSLVEQNDMVWNCTIKNEQNGWEYQNRKWRYEVHPFLFKWNGQRINIVKSIIRMNTNNLSTFGAYETTKNVANMIKHWHENYSNSMPPGMFPHEAKDILADDYIDIHM